MNPKIILGKENVLAKNNFGSKKFLIKKFWTKKVSEQTKLGSRKVKVKQGFGVKKLEGQKIFVQIRLSIS